MPHRAPIGYYRTGRKTHPVHARTGMGKMRSSGQQYAPLPSRIIEFNSRTPVVSQHIVNIAKGKAKPRTVEEARAALMYMEGERKIRLAKELEAKKALLAFEKGTGTTAGLKRTFKELPQSSTRARVEIERKARRQVGLALHRLRGFRF